MWYAPLKTELTSHHHIICRFRAGSKTVRPVLRAATLMWSTRTVHWRSTSPSRWTVESTPALPPTTWGSRRTTCTWRSKVRHGSCHNSEERDWTRGSTLKLFKDYNTNSLCHSVFQSPPASSSSQSTRWSREAWAPRSSVKSNTTRPSSPPWPGSKTMESYPTMRGANRLLATARKNNCGVTKEKCIIHLWFSVVRFLVDTDSLTIKDVTDGDEGTYTCVMNTTLDQDSASAMLTVVGAFSRVFAPF